MDDEEKQKIIKFKVWTDKGMKEFRYRSLCWSLSCLASPEMLYLRFLGIFNRYCLREYFYRRDQFREYNASRSHNRRGKR